jgi:polyphenol oxidase
MSLYIQSKMLCDAGFPVHGFTIAGNYGFDGPDDDTAVIADLAALRAELATDLPLIRLKQVHGATTVDAETARLAPLENNGWNRRPEVEGDALISSDSPALLGVLSADCLPILLASSDTGHVAAIHAGWRGLSKGIVQRSVKQLLAAGGTVEAMRCAIGPAICYDCYDVGSDVADRFPESVDPLGKDTGSWLLDLPCAAEVSLIASGLSLIQIEKLGVCTRCSPLHLHSHRRDGSNSGRQLSFIARRGR